MIVMGRMLFNIVLSPFLGIGVTVPFFQAIGILLVLIDKLKRKVICSIKVLKAAIYNLVLILVQPDGFEGLSSLRYSDTTLTVMVGSKRRVLICGLKVHGLLA